MRAVVDSAEMSEVEHGYELLEFADALMGSDEAQLEGARRYLRAALGDGGTVEAAAVAANFNQMDRIADATGIPLDAPVRDSMGPMWDELGIRGFGTAANTMRFLKS